MKRMNLKWSWKNTTTVGVQTVIGNFVKKHQSLQGRSSVYNHFTSNFQRVLSPLKNTNQHSKDLIYKKIKCCLLNVLLWHS